MRLTTSLYYTPSGRSIQKLGITPDILVPQAKVELLEARPSRSEASLRNAIRNGNGKKDAKKNDPAAKDPAAKPNPADGAAAKTKEAEKPQDYQLTRAVDLLQGIALYQNAAAE